MHANPYLQRLDEEIHSAGPVELVVILHRALAARICEARDALSAGDAPRRAAAVSQAIAIVGELAQSLRPEAGPALAGRLRSLYAFLVERLLEANANQSHAPLGDALRVASVLAEAWSAISQANAMPQPVSSQEAVHLSCCG